ncbi:(2Fe-2S)-binding protein [Paraburkholderia metrosideri]|uniref:(2Fe-2S)-binding protein n=1 Tax=Paraburkholderia metrosideri TaxID=580937 RepID=A0ABW9E2T9_9BURK
MSRPDQLAVFNVDRETVDVRVRQHHLLVDVLRDGCGRTGVKEGCESASCGACTVLIEGQPTLSCITLALDAAGKAIQTVEGLVAPDGSLHLLQKAFIDNHAIQCGFCTPGMLLAAVALLERNPDPTESDVREAISGNICRCTGYVRIVRAILAAAALEKSEASNEQTEVVQ